MSVNVSVGGSDVEAEVDQDIEQFERWFCTYVDSSAPRITGAERAIIKTWIWYKLHQGEVPSGAPTGG